MFTISGYGSIVLILYFGGTIKKQKFFKIQIIFVFTKTGKMVIDDKLSAQALVNIFIIISLKNKNYFLSNFR